MSCNLEHSKEDQKARLEYAIHYQKANQKHSIKVFKITENNYKKGKYTYSRKQSFQNMSTRKHYPGLHKITLIINGTPKQTQTFHLIS